MEAGMVIWRHHLGPMHPGQSSVGENDCVSNSAVNGVRLNFACHHKPKVPEACCHETEWICEDCEEFNRIDEHLEVLAEEEG